jgi:hypothetical protein
MSIHQDLAVSGPVFRIAIPSWRIGVGPRLQTSDLNTGPSRAEFQELLETGLNPGELRHARLTKSERRQLSAARRLRDALYPSNDFA